MNTHDHLQNNFKGDILSRDNICPGTKCRGTKCLLTIIMVLKSIKESVISVISLEYISIYPLRYILSDIVTNIGEPQCSMVSPSWLGGVNHHGQNAPSSLILSYFTISTIGLCTVFTLTLYLSVVAPLHNFFPARFQWRIAAPNQCIFPHR